MRTTVGTLVSLALLAASLVACDGDDADRVARLEIKTPSLSTFTGRSVPISALVTAYDANGREILSPSLTVTLPPGWTRAGDMIVAPSTEARGAIRFSAEGVSAVRASIGVAPSFALASLVDDSVEVVAAVDLRLHRWQAAWGCRARGLAGGVPPIYSGKRTAGGDSIYVDSARYAATIDTSLYLGDSSFYYTGFTANIPWTAQQERFLSDGSRDTVTARDTVVLGRQRPDSLSIYPPDRRGSNQLAFVRRSGSLTSPPLKYVGGSWCRFTVWGQPQDSTRFEERVTLPSP